MWRELAIPGRMVTETDIKWHEKRLQRLCQISGGLWPLCFAFPIQNSPTSSPIFVDHVVGNYAVLSPSFQKTFTQCGLGRNVRIRVEGSDHAGEIHPRPSWRFRDAACTRPLKIGDEGRGKTWHPVVMLVLLRLVTAMRHQ